MKKNRTKPHRLAFGIALSLILGMAVAADDPNAYFPRTPIDPTKGVEGDMEWSGTLPFWRDTAALEANHHLATDHDNEWKLNNKHIDHRDDMHPGYLDVEIGEKLVKDWSKRHPEFLTCLGEGKTELKGVATTFPKYDAKLKRVITLEGHIQRCAADTFYMNLQPGMLNNIRIAYYMKSLSAGMPINVDIKSGPLMESFKRGEDLFFKRAGQFGFACATCHAPNGLLGKRLRGNVLTTPFGDAASYPAYMTGRGELTSLQQRMRICQVQMRTAPLKPGDRSYDDLEVLFTVMSNGYPLAGVSMR